VTHRRSGENCRERLLPVAKVNRADSRLYRSTELNYDQLCSRRIVSLGSASHTNREVGAGTIRQDPALLGLGELEVKDIERMQPRAFSVTKTVAILISERQRRPVDVQRSQVRLTHISPIFQRIKRRQGAAGKEIVVDEYAFRRHGQAILETRGRPRPGNA
jgi:hypothetical protein